MLVDGVKVIADPTLTNEEIMLFVAEEKRLWESNNKKLGQLELGLDGEEVIVKGTEGQPDVIEPHLISIMRSVTLGTTMQGNVDTIIPRYVNSAMAWFGRPARVLVIHSACTVQCVIAAICSALRSSTEKTVSHISSVGARIEYWICE